MVYKPEMYESVGSTFILMKISIEIDGRPKLGVRRKNSQNQ
jgi:hypothetical protein